MGTYRLRITTAAPSASPWQADTLWGHLCWLLAGRRGEAALGDFLAAYQIGEPPLVLSDGFPAGRLPRPLLPPPAPTARTKQAGIEAARAGKANAGALLPFAAFEALRRGESVDSEAQVAAFTSERRVATFHNQVNRNTGTAGGDDEESGELFTIEAIHLPVVDFYLRIEADFLPLLRELLADLQIEGYGKRRSVGYGALAGWELEPFDGFGDVAEPNAFVTLSRFVPAGDDPTDGRWRTAVKFGKVGGVTDHPFKRPLVMLTAGSWFRVAGAPREWYGRIVPDISPAHPEALHYGLAFALPLRVSEEDVA